MYVVYIYFQNIYIMLYVIIQLSSTVLYGENRVVYGGGYGALGLARSVERTVAAVSVCTRVCRVSGGVRQGRASRIKTEVK